MDKSEPKEERIESEEFFGWLIVCAGDCLAPSLSNMFIVQEESLPKVFPSTLKESGLD